MGLLDMAKERTKPIQPRVGTVDDFSKVCCFTNLSGDLLILICLIRCFPGCPV